MTTEFSNFISNFDDPAYQKDLIRPVEIKEDVKLLQQRKRVSNIMKSKLFKKNLENIYKSNNLENNTDGKSTSTLFLADINEQLLLSALPKMKIESLYQLNKMKGIIWINDLYDDNNSPYDKNERLSRCKLASVFRLLDMYGWSNEFNGVLTMRPSNDRELFLINPFGLLFHEITASSLIVMDFKGHILDYGSTVLDIHPTNWLIHSAIYSNRLDIKVILHLKTPASIFVSSSETGLLPLSTEAILLGNVLILNNLYNGQLKSQNMLTEYICSINADHIPRSKLFIVPNNGILVCGYTIEEAWIFLSNCQVACEIQMKMSNFGIDDFIIPSKEAQDNILNMWNSNNNSTGLTQWNIGQMEFESLIRYLDNNGYRSGYFYHQENILNNNENMISKNSHYKVEDDIPTSYKYDIYTLQDEQASNKALLKTTKEKWFNTPNMYKLLEDGNYNDLKQQMDKKSSRWISIKEPSIIASTPQRPVTAGAYVSFGFDISKSNISKDMTSFGVNSKEFKETQKKVRNKYYHDTNTAGPMSCLLDSGLNSDEKKRLKNVAIKNEIVSGFPTDEVVTSASKGVIQRGHKAIVFQDLYRPSNPFENITDDDLNNYQLEIDKKLKSKRYNGNCNKIEVIPKEEKSQISIPQSRSTSSVSKKSFHEDIAAKDEPDQVTDIVVPEESQQIFQILEKPVCGTITSETSGADFSHDELERQGKVKKKRRFKLPSFVKKIKDKRNKN